MEPWMRLHYSCGIVVRVKGVVRVLLMWFSGDGLENGERRYTLVKAFGN